MQTNSQVGSFMLFDYLHTSSENKTNNDYYKKYGLSYAISVKVFHICIS